MFMDKLFSHDITAAILDLFWCPKTTRQQPFGCPKPILWELNSYVNMFFSKKISSLLATGVKMLYVTIFLGNVRKFNDIERRVVKQLKH